MKFLGFVLVTVSSAVCGLCYCTGKSEHVNDLRSFCLMIEIMQGEITYRLSPLPELAVSVSERVQGRASNFLSVLSLNLNFLGEKDFDRIWCESLEACRPELDEKELEAIAALGKILGRYDVNTQSEAISVSLTYLRSKLNKESSELPQLKKLSLSVSMSAGALLAILLV